MKEPNGKPTIRREVRELLLLFEISQILDQTIDLRDAVGPVLDAMGKNRRMLRGTLTLLDREVGELFIEAAHGLSQTQQERGRYRYGEGVTGKVVATGHPAVVPHISDEPLFLDRTGARQNLRKEDISFICVPIKLGAKVIGALSADRLFENDISLEEDVRLLSIIGSMIAQAVRLRQETQEERRKLLEENQRLQDQLKERFRPSNIVGNSKVMRDVYELIGQVSRSDTTVLIRGESGTGKELVAHAIHYNSLRASRPFIKVNCGALPETVVESELFGHERGAFTGAVAARKGRFELAHTGTIFLDEIGDLSRATQIKLLRVLQEKEFERVGGTTTIKVDVRIITATNRDLELLISEEKVQAGPVLEAERIPRTYSTPKRTQNRYTPSGRFFCRKIQQGQHQDRQTHLHPCHRYAHELPLAGERQGTREAAIERAVLLSSDGVIHGRHLPPTLQTAEESNTSSSGALDSTLAAMERDLIVDALKAARGNKAKAARALGITERIMGLRVKGFNIDPRRFRTSKS